MSVVIQRIPRRVQPPLNASVDTSGIIGRTLVHAWLPHHGPKDLVNRGRALVAGVGSRLQSGGKGIEFVFDNTTTAGITASAGGFSTLTPTSQPLVFYSLFHVAALGTRRVLVGDWNSAGTGLSFAFQASATNFWNCIDSTGGTYASTAAVTVGWHTAVIASTSNQLFKVWIDGALVIDAGTSAARAAGSTAGLPSTGAYVVGLAKMSAVALLAVGNVFPSAAMAAAFTDNPWRIFTPLFRGIWVPGGASGANITPFNPPMRAGLGRGMSGGMQG